MTLHKGGRHIAQVSVGVVYQCQPAHCTRFCIMDAKPLGSAIWHTTRRLQIQAPKGADLCTSRRRNMAQNASVSDRLSQEFRDQLSQEFRDQLSQEFRDGLHHDFRTQPSNSRVDISSGRKATVRREESPLGSSSPQRMTVVVGGRIFRRRCCGSVTPQNRTITTSINRTFF